MFYFIYGMLFPLKSKLLFLIKTLGLTFSSSYFYLRNKTKNLNWVQINVNLQEQKI